MYISREQSSQGRCGVLWRPVLEVSKRWARETVLFLCTYNAARSQIGEGFINAPYSDRYEARSTGSEPTKVHPCAIIAMARWASTSLPTVQSTSTSLSGCTLIMWQPFAPMLRGAVLSSLAARPTCSTQFLIRHQIPDTFGRDVHRSGRCVTRSGRGLVQCSEVLMQRLTRLRCYGCAF